MKRVIHPGPVAAERSTCIPSRGRAITISLRAGVALNTAIADAMTAQQLGSVWLEINDAPIDALAYVIPDKAPNDQTVAWYSQTYRLDGAGQIDHLGVIIGHFEQAPFLHGHGSWTDAAGVQKMGHILAHETILAQDIEVQGFAFENAQFERLYDAETNFSLFQPTQKSATKDAAYALLRIRPNEDFTTALDAACKNLRWQQAKAYGLGSLVGAEFEDGISLDSFATEFLILDADARADHAPRPGPEIVIVGEAGGSGIRGRLKRGENPVLITAEIFLERTDR